MSNPQDRQHLDRPVFRSLQGRDDITHEEIIALAREIEQCHLDAKHVVPLASYNQGDKLGIAWLEVGEDGHGVVMSVAEDGFTAEEELKESALQTLKLTKGVRIGSETGQE